MKRNFIALVAGLAIASILTMPAYAATVTILVGKTNGTRIETVVTPGPELDDTIIPAVDAIPGRPATAGGSHPTDVRNGACPMVPAMNGVLHHPVGLNADCVFAYSLSDRVGMPEVLPVAGVPEQIIDNGYGPDVTTHVTVQTCTRKYKTISTSPPYVSTSQSTSDGSC